MVFVKNLKFCERFVLWEIHPEKVFGDVLLRKEAFLDHINMDLKRRQNWHFCMILVKKLKFFHLLYLSKIDPEKEFADVLDKKKPLKTLKTTVYEKRKITIFPKGLVHRLDRKLEISSTFIFMQNRPRKSIWELSS